MAADEDRTDGTARDTDPAGAGATTEPDERDWTNGSPPVDGRAEPAIRAAAKARAPYYTGPAWDPDAGGPGATILQLFAHLAAGVIERLDQVPGKHRHAFVDELGFDRLPPQPATVPLSIQVSGGAGGNVRIPAGTRALAEATETRPELTYEVGEGFEATPAPFDRVVSVDPAVDHVADHHVCPPPDGDTILFGGDNDQQHDLYLGDADALTTGDGGGSDGDSGTDGGAGSPPRPILRVAFRTNADPALLRTLNWEYFGTAPGDDAKQWRDLPFRDGGGAGASGDQVDLTEVADVLAEYGYELTTESAAVVERWLLTTVLARGVDRAAGTPPPYADATTDPALADMYADLAALARRQLGSLDDPLPSGTLTDETLDFELPGAVEKSTEFGTESRWIRCRIPDDVPQPVTEQLLGIELASVTVATGRPTVSGDERASIQADALLATDIPLEVPPATESGGNGADTKIRPFGTRPQRRDSFYVASAEAFTKTDQRVTLTVDVKDVRGDPEDPPSVSWEYWNGSGWARLPLVDPAATDVAFLETPKSTVEFDVPADLASTTVSGHEGHWIRARLVGGGYGDIIYPGEPREDLPEGGVWQRIDEVTEPVLTSLGISYESPSGGLEAVTPTAATRHNNLAVETPDLSGQFRPFDPVPSDDQALYLGFNGQLRNGPLHLYLSLADFEYPTDFYPRVRWEVWLGDAWEPLSVRDGTEGLTETGVVRFTVPEPTAPREEFGTERHWVRARVATPGGFGPAPYRPVGGRAGGIEEGERDRCGVRLPTTPPGGDPVMALPETDLVAPNTVLAANVRTVTDEIVGSGDGTADQTFAVSSPPVRSASVWVDELATLSAGVRTALADDPAVETKAVGNEGDLDAFWVAWEAVDDFLASGPDDRHFVLDRVAGTLTFGDGTRGAVPPTGRDNVRVSYETGGGAAGNVDAGDVSGLEGSLAFVDGVANHVPADGGADAESSRAVLERAPEQLRDRNRAVAPVDYERLAKASARKLARAECLPGLDIRGSYRPGWVTVLVVPRSGATKPVPTASLKAQVTDGLAEHAPAALLGEEGDERLVVRGPTYVEATVEATVVAETTSSQSELEAAAAASLAAFFHPLTGGDDGDGWAFGELPCVSDCFAVLEGVDGVDHVADLLVRFRADDVERTVRPGEDAPDIAADVLVHSGPHEIDAVGGL